jgi:hypothetical protein
VQKQRQRSTEGSGGWVYCLGRVRPAVVVVLTALGIWCRPAMRSRVRSWPGCVDAHKGAIRRRRLQQQTEQAWCLTLTTHAVITWMTEYLGLAVDQLRGQGRRVDEEILAHMSPRAQREHRPVRHHHRRHRGRTRPTRPHPTHPPVTDHYASRR